MLKRRKKVEGEEEEKADGKSKKGTQKRKGETSFVSYYQTINQKAIIKLVS